MSRGFIYIKENGQLINEIENLVNETLENLFKKERTTFLEIKNTIKSVVSTFLFHKTRRNPMIIPVIMNKIDENESNFNFIKKESKTTSRRTKKEQVVETSN